MVLGYDMPQNMYQSIRRLPLASPISPNFVRRREDKTIRHEDLRLHQMNDVIEVPIHGQQLSRPLAGVEHAGLHRVLRHLDDFGGLVDGLFAIIDEVDDFAMLLRHESEAGAQLRAAVLDENHLFWRVGGILNELQGGVVDLGNPASALCQA